MINIIYEDNHLLVVEKPSGILSQADKTGDMDMLTILKTYLREKYQKSGNVYLGLVHRLDRMTSGVMVFCKTSKAAARLNEQMKNHIFIKKYYAVVEGIVPDFGRLEHYLKKNEIEVKSYVTDDKSGKFACLEYQKIKEVNGNSVISVLLKTGRHHQIRVQFSYVGHPLLGDQLYGNGTKNTLMLHAYYLSFYHPITKEKLEFIVQPTAIQWKDYIENV